MDQAPDTSRRAYRIWLGGLSPRAPIISYQEWVRELMLDWLDDKDIDETAHAKAD